MIPASETEKQMMRLALTFAEEAAAAGEIPIGAVLVSGTGDVVAVTRNRQNELQDPTAHAEILAIREGTKKLGSRYLSDCTLYVTLEPCVMCAGAIAHARPSRLIFAAWDEKAGAVGSMYDVLRDARLPYQSLEVAGGVCEEEAKNLLQSFFAARR